jgi:hypothetical protein
MQMNAYRVLGSDNTEKFSLRTEKEGSVRHADYASIPDLARAIRSIVQSWQKRNEGEIKLIFSPLADIEWRRNQSAPLRCYPLEKSQREGVWPAMIRPPEELTGSS